MSIKRAKVLGYVGGVPAVRMLQSMHIIFQEVML